MPSGSPTRGWPRWCSTTVTLARAPASRGSWWTSRSSSRTMKPRSPTRGGSTGSIRSAWRCSAARSRAGTCWPSGHAMGGSPRSSPSARSRTDSRRCRCSAPQMPSRRPWRGFETSSARCSADRPTTSRPWASPDHSRLWLRQTRNPGSKRSCHRRPAGRTESPRGSRYGLGPTVPVAARRSSPAPYLRAYATRTRSRRRTARSSS